MHQFKAVVIGKYNGMYLCLFVNEMLWFSEGEC